MSGATVKICGLKTIEALEAVIAAGAEMAGFVFFDKSPRHICLNGARLLGAQAQSRIGKVALVVDADDLLIAGIVEALRPDFLQLHGREDARRIADIRQRFALPVIKAFGISAKADVLRALVQAGPAERLLFDAQPPPGASHPGGNGLAFDWTILAGVDIGRPWMLSGGLDPGNVAQAMALSGATSVDVSSGVESGPGLKDVAKIAAFVAAAKG